MSGNKLRGVTTFVTYDLFVWCFDFRSKKYRREWSISHQSYIKISTKRSPENRLGNFYTFCYLKGVAHCSQHDWSQQPREDQMDLYRQGSWIFVRWSFGQINRNQTHLCYWLVLLVHRLPEWHDATYQHIRFISDTGWLFSLGFIKRRSKINKQWSRPPSSWGLVRSLCSSDPYPYR